MELSSIGLQSNTRIFFNDALTTRNLNILRKAKSLEKEHKVFKAFTKKGIVNVIINKDSTPQMIQDINTLSNLKSNKAQENLFVDTNIENIQKDFNLEPQNVPLTSNENNINYQNNITADMSNQNTLKVNIERNKTSIENSPIASLDSSFSSTIETIIESFIDEIRSPATTTPKPTTELTKRTLRSNSTSSLQSHSQPQHKYNVN